MSTSKSSETGINLEVQRLLAKYECPYKFHEVRAAFMGAIASPYVVDPVFELNALWDGEFPELDSNEALEEVQQVFLKDFWNMLATHADEDAEQPFSLTSLPAPATVNELKAHAQLRGEELDAFIDAFFQDQENVELTDEVAESVDIVEELIGMCSEVMNMDSDKDLSADEIKEIVGNMEKLHDMAEIELNNMILSCA